MRKIKVLVVDDSPVFRSLLTELISSDPDLEVVGSAEDPYEARELIKKLNPDVLTLDIEMPKMNGVQFLKNLMRLRPMPVVMISTLTQHGADTTLHALELGAVDYFPKPAMDSTGDMLGYKDLINSKIKIASGANVSSEPLASQSIETVVASGKSKLEIIGIGASTGGTEAVRNVLSALPSGLPPIVITQHISAMFTKSFAERLDSISEVKVQELSAGTVPLVKGCAYVAPGDKHMVIIRKGSKLYGQVDDRPPVNRHKPSVDVMFDSIAEAVGVNAMAIILTGMGNDGAQGMLKMKEQGAITIAQDEKTSVVWGMPRVAVEIGAAMHVKPLFKIPKVLAQYVNE
ncbi:chemotaxis response regulator protein-glutamate methylesterase [Vibrio sp. T187]|uniref:protein-glutamate methylesterase/protein-glutamine glutaminase n=1 Tax=Vibrio TaxID=662 RepID=UPI0010C99460|nr:MULTISPECIES: chemotaxis response regulator protein-glutamate methylesterase [Vibrio]MBW3695249.1 chemotaxis response regulator protein-glutamate methylesterase [Vibrio sp. T187]